MKTHLNATAKFYTGFALALAVIIGVSWYAGYRSGYRAAEPARHATHAAP